MKVLLYTYKHVFNRIRQFFVVRLLNLVFYSISDHQLKINKQAKIKILKPRIFISFIVNWCLLFTVNCSTTRQWERDIIKKDSHCLYCTVKWLSIIKWKGSRNQNRWIVFSLKSKMFRPLCSVKVTLIKIKQIFNDKCFQNNHKFLKAFDLSLDLSIVPLKQKKYEDVTCMLTPRIQAPARPQCSYYMQRFINDIRLKRVQTKAFLGN